MTTLTARARTQCLGHHTTMRMMLRQLSRAALVVGALSGAPGIVPLCAQGASTRSAAPAAAPDTVWHATMTGPVPLIRRISGVRADSGAFRELYQTPAGTSSGAHRHTADMWIKVLSGR